MARAVLTPRARRELGEAAAWIAKDSRTAAQALRRNVDRALAVIGEHPEIGGLRPELAAEPIRFYLVSGFPYLLVYASDRRPPAVIRVLHGARDLDHALSGQLSPSPRRS